MTISNARAGWYRIGIETAKQRRQRAGGEEYDLQGLEIETSETPQNIPVLRVTGEIDLHSCPELRAALQNLMDAGRFYIVLDLSGVPYLDSAALGVMVDAVRRSRDNSGSIYLSNMTPFVRRAFEITRLIKIFHIYEDVKDATTAAAADAASVA